jgi:hypothetical protein
MPREPTYSDDAADFLPEAPPESYDADDAMTEPSAYDAGRVPVDRPAGGRGVRAAGGADGDLRPAGALLADAGIW